MTSPSIQPPAAPPPLIQMKGIVKRFPGVLALDHVDFELLPGEVHILLGENGAGKSTLIKVLSGAYSHDEGDIFIQGERVEITSPQVPLDKGLRFIYQEINLVPQIDIARNMFLGMEPMAVRALGLVDKRALYSRAREYLKRFHIDLDPHEIVGRLSVTQQKMVEIARALVTEAKAFVLDEPTDVLEDRSRHDLFDLINKLKQSHQVGFIYISHRYAEVYELGDRVTILRDGHNAGTYPISELTLDSMIEKMIGGQVKKQYPDLPAPAADEALRIEHLSQGRRLDDISFSVRRGEIVGVTGLMGAGKTELARAIAGVDLYDAGEIIVHGKKVRHRTPSRAIRNGIAYLTENRKTEGLILDQSIRNNYALPNIDRLSPGGLTRHRRIDSEVDGYMRELQVKAPGRDTNAGQLSGGNQQKIVLAKWLGARCKVLLFDEPTRGIDIKGRAEVYRIMRELLEQGVGIVMMTSDYTEALEMSHRILVMHRGKIRKEFQRGEAQEEDILRVAIGA
ncbi:MAG: sugar ABC transporter ATP-binding protein [Candidatus Sumerlaeota bacterium]|nr:sugar ABC transporter ATP-binding protein [Candidatus Sumerlaeota bacterium]